MKTVLLKALALFFMLGSWVFSPAALGADSAALQKAKKEAEAKGYAFLTDRDEIVAKAKKEGRLRAIGSMESATIKATIAAFTKRYPFIDFYFQESTGSDAAQRLLLEVKSGVAKEWDVVGLSTDFRTEYIPYLWKADILAMVERGILRIPPQMIDPKQRNIASFQSRFAVTAYNKNLVPANQLPKVWEDLLKPEFKGRKLALDIRPTEIAGLVPAWGLEKMLDFSRKIATQNPFWVRGATRTLTSVLAGEIPMMVGPNFHTVKGVQAKDPAGVLQYAILEPVPLTLALQMGILAASPHTHAALLFFEWMASPEAQKIADENEPMNSSVYVRGGAVEQELKGKKLSIPSWEDYQRIGEWQSKIFEAFGFPKAELKK